MKIFVIHYEKLVNRKINIKKQLEACGLGPEFISNHPKENLTAEEKGKFICISDSEISTFMHHIECYKKLINQDEYEYALILEDDALFCDNFKIRLGKYITDLPPQWDVFFIGEGAFSVPLYIKNKMQEQAKCDVCVFRKPANLFKYTDFYLIKKDFCKEFVNYFINNNRIDSAIDGYLHEFINKRNKKAFVASPKLVKQGSINKTYPSSIFHSANSSESNPNYVEI